MKVLFVSSANNSYSDISPFIKIQGETISSKGIYLEYYPLKQKGALGYFRESLKLRSFLKYNKFDLIHAHYTLSGWVVVLSGTKIPIVLSVMGDDAYGTYVGVNKIKFSSKILTTLLFLIQPFIDFIISKSKNIDKYIYIKNSQIIPNGVNIIDSTKDKFELRSELGLDPKKKYILFLGNKNDIRKNYKLVESAIKYIKNEEVQILAPYPIPHDFVPKYLYSADVFVLSSFMEGSPNVIKEALACNCPIVATDVGDVRWVIGNTEGCYIAEFDIKDFAEKINLALEFEAKRGRTNGRDRIIELGLDSESVAKRIIDVYQQVLYKKK